MERNLFLLQRGTAALLAGFTIVHLGVIFFAMEQGLTAAEILGRTRGSIFWGLFYGLFVLAAALHAPIGLRAVAREWTGWSARSCDLLSLLVGATLLLLGLRAVIAVVLP